MKFLVLLSWVIVALAAPPAPGPIPVRPSPPPPSPPSTPVLTSPTGIFTRAGGCSSVGLTNLTQPVAPTALPAPGADNILAAIVVGRGVQNYTCTANSTAGPVQLGAVATLYEASCAAANNPNILSTISQDAFNTTVPPGAVAPVNLRLTSGLLQRAGRHYFSASGIPTFDLTADGSLGFAMVTKTSASPAPAGGNAVAWLELLKATGTTGPITAIYRLNTVGGSPPATCHGLPAVFSVQYAAQYWVYTASV